MGIKIAREVLEAKIRYIRIYDPQAPSRMTTPFEVVGVGIGHILASIFFFLIQETFIERISSFRCLARLTLVELRVETTSTLLMTA